MHVMSQPLRPKTLQVIVSDMATCIQTLEAVETLDAKAI